MSEEVREEAKRFGLSLDAAFEFFQDLVNYLSPLTLKPCLFCRDGIIAMLGISVGSQEGKMRPGLERTVLLFQKEGCLFFWHPHFSLGPKC